MRYNFSPSLWILIYLFFVWNYKRFNCNDICKNPDLEHYENVIFENDTYRYSLHYYYSMRIQRNQSQPVPSERFKNMIHVVYKARPQFSISFYGSHIREIDFHKRHGDTAYEFGRSYIGNTYNYIENYKKSEYRVLHEKELLGAKWTFSINVNGSEVTAIMTSLIHPNGKLSFYYDNIPTENEEIKLLSGIVGSIRCEGGLKKPEISVPAKWIKCGSLVEFEVIGEICSQYNTSETCQNATTSITTCIWCEKGEKCIESNNPDTHDLKVNDCRVQKKSDVNDFSTSTPIKDIETTLRSTEVQVTENLIETTEERYKHLTTKTTDENKQHKSHWYLYVVIPLVASLFLICIGCIIWRWLLRRKRSDE
uniref:Egg protein CP391S-like protein n=1 Tax=Schistosoma mansoni TaxID=6183 RepID=A0AA82N7Y3_SCHMA